jgi:hypothetical protein
MTDSYEPVPRKLYIFSNLWMTKHFRKSLRFSHKNISMFYVRVHHGSIVPIHSVPSTADFHFQFDHSTLNLGGHCTVEPFGIVSTFSSVRGLKGLSREIDFKNVDKIF